MLPILFKSTEQGAPTLNNAAGSLISVLDACLVTGFNTIGITSVSILNNVATVVTSANHGLAVDNRVTVTGVSISAANGDKTVATVVSPTSYTYSCATPNATENPVSASCRRTPLGWAKEFSGTDKAVYKMTDLASYGQRLRVDDSTAGTDARVIGVENPTTVDAYSDAFPTEVQRSGGGYWHKGANNTTGKFWAIVGDERFFYYVVESSAYYGAYTLTNIHHTGGYFGDIVSFKNGEAYGCIIGGGISPASSNPQNPAVIHNNIGSDPGTFYMRYICRQHTGIAKSISTGFCHPGGGSSSSSSNYPIYPSPVDNGLVFAEPSLVIEQLPTFGNPIRGVLPGAVQALCRYTSLSDTQYGETLTASDGSGLRVIVFKNMTSTSASLDSALALKLSAAWR